MKITEELARKILDLSGAGLVYGLGNQVPGEMCAQALICYVLGEPHNAKPSCVDDEVNSFNIRLNDIHAWGSNKERSLGMRRLMIASLGSKDVIDIKAFRARIKEMTIRTAVPFALREAAKKHPDAAHKAAFEAAAVKCENDGTTSAADATYAARRAARRAADADSAADAASLAADAAYSAYSASAADARAFLHRYAEAAVQILVDLKSPGAEFLHLAPYEEV